MLTELEKTEICSLLKTSKTVAVVGISSDTGKISRKIADFLVSKNYKVAGVNPAAPVIPGIPVYKSLCEIPFEIDIVNVFRKSESIGEIMPDVLKVNPKCLWLQLDIINDSAMALAFEKGISIVQDKCILVYYNQCCPD